MGFTLYFYVIIYHQLRDLNKDFIHCQGLSKFTKIARSVTRHKNALQLISGTPPTHRQRVCSNEWHHQESLKMVDNDRPPSFREVII